MARLLVPKGTAAFFALSPLFAPVFAGSASISTLPTIPSWASDSFMSFSLRSKNGYDFSVYPLTAEAGLNQSSSAQENINLSGEIHDVNATNFDSYEPSSAGIVYLSCDPSTDGPDPSSLLNSVMGRKPLAIVTYSIDAAVCSVSGENLSYTRIFTMNNAHLSQRALEFISGQDSVMAKISGASTFTPNDDATTPSATPTPTLTPKSSKSKSHGTTIAMGLLYGVTGLISVTFFVILATGAVRAHRFPERYGPSISWGDIPRQGRARGLARAVLDTMPVIKFGDPEPRSKPDPEHDLESGSVVEVPPPAVVRNDVEMHDVQRAVSRPSVTQETTDASRPGTGENASGSVSANEPSAVSATSAIREDESIHLGCSICTEDFQRGEDVRVLSCSHKFHPACIDPWLMDISSTCPLW
ncbi:hypothetical protein TD95_002772 [Thielaviopsis punctulata]|uniref:RING-type E3 ubiquitin transferase n=1 Tax=Thielaviopsis punctulata TaxID=72032 RepID=A0A0F4ZG80_9PEZI|nr:hypothetical protein TD95_002772 [Thielaviopsis punctulata]